MASVSAGDSSGMLPNPKKIGGVPANPRGHFLIGIRRQLQRQRADKRPLAIPLRPFGCQPRKADLVVGLDFQRSPFGNASRRGPCRLR